MENFVTRSKYVSETISIVVDFADVLPAGQTIQGTPTVNVALDTGYDPTPASILYLGVSVTNGTVVEQRFRLGIPGVIYNLSWQVTNGTEFFEKTTYIAILPNIGSAAPNHQYLFLTSQLYPLIALDTFKSTFFPLNGIFQPVIVFYTCPPEKLTSTFAPQNGLFTPGQLFYTMLPEQLKSTFTPANGILTLAQVFYTSGPDQIKSSFSPLNGSIQIGQVFYTTKPDMLQSTFQPQNGILA